MAFYVDTHCHLDLFPSIRQTVISEEETLIKTISVINTPALWHPNRKLFAGCRNIRVALGLHPEIASQREKETVLFTSLCHEAKYIGEVGLDGVSRDPNERNTQLKVFRHILHAVKHSTTKMLTVHSRRATRETIDELRTALDGTPHKVVMHWYSGSIVDLRHAIDLGFYFSVNHVMLASRNTETIIQTIPKKAILTETDAPFTFSPSISNRQQSLNTTIKLLSKFWGQDEEDVKQGIWNNFSTMVRAIN